MFHLHHHLSKAETTTAEGGSSHLDPQLIQDSRSSRWHSVWTPTSVQLPFLLSRHFHILLSKTLLLSCHSKDCLMSPIRFLSTFTFSFNVVLGCFLIFKMCCIKKLGQTHQHLAGDGSLVKDLSGFYAMVAPKEFMRGLHQKSGPISHPVGTWQVPGLSGPSGREAHQTPHTGQRGLTKIRLSEWGRWDISHIVHRWRPDSFCPLPLHTTDPLQTISVNRGWLSLRVWMGSNLSFWAEWTMNKTLSLVIWIMIERTPISDALCSTFDYHHCTIGVCTSWPTYIICIL